MSERSLGSPKRRKKRKFKNGPVKPNAEDKKMLN